MARDEQGRGRRLKAQERKWSKDLMAGGWTAIPNIIVVEQRALGLDALDVNIILHLSTLWAAADHSPSPAKRALAQAIGVDPRTVQRRIAALEKKGLIRREARHHPSSGSKSNLYHFDGLIAAALPLVGAAPDADARDRDAARE
jgi:lambda repressor-like predicted transcriptional regulator